jgi:hypothetical protein
MNVRPAQATLNEIRGGDLLEEIALQIHEAVAAVNEHQKKAVLTIVLEIDMPKNMKNLSDPYLVMTGECTSKLPRADTAQTLFKVDDDGNLTRNLQRAQTDLPLSIHKGA